MQTKLSKKQGKHCARKANNEINFQLQNFVSANAFFVVWLLAVQNSISLNFTRISIFFLLPFLFITRIFASSHWIPHFFISALSSTLSCTWKIYFSLENIEYGINENLENVGAGKKKKVTWYGKLFELEKLSVEAHEWKNTIITVSSFRFIYSDNSMESLEIMTKKSTHLRHVPTLFYRWN